MMTATRPMWAAAVTTLTLFAAGCGSFGGGVAATPATAPQAEQAGSNNVIRADVTDIRPIEAKPAGLVMTPMYDSPPQPVVYDTVATPAPVVSITPTIAAAADTAISSASAAAGSTKHTVRRGETLFSIARSSYGSGKAWKKIASANPGLTPASLRVGQTINMP